MSQKGILKRNIRKEIFQKDILKRYIEKECLKKTY